MLTVYGEGRGFRVVWLLEEMGLPYRFRPVDMLAGVENDPEFLQINPSGFIPALVDGNTVMVESIAIMDYLLARYGPHPLAPDPQSDAFAPYRQFLMMGEAGLAGASYWVLNARFLPTEAERDNPTVRHALRQYHNRMKLVRRQLERTQYLAGDGFTAADISVAYALLQSWKSAGIALEAPEAAYLDRCRDRDGFRRALEVCTSHASWG
jgi:glutathione S-transferase